MVNNHDAPSPRPTNLTDLFVRSFGNDTGKRLEIRDTKTTGLVLRVTPSNTKTFSLQTRDPGGRKIRLNIGRYPIVSVKEARSIAKQRLAEIAKGKDPREAAREAKALNDVETLTLSQLLDETEAALSPSRAMWRRGHRRWREKPEARAAIENVFHQYLNDSLSEISIAKISSAVKNYKPNRPRKHKVTANGASARALAYLKTVFDWGSNRNRFLKEGAGRSVKLNLPDLAWINDPSADDPTLEYKRERVLSQEELTAVFPLFTYPAPTGLRKRLDPEKDFGPAAFKFLFLTLSRIEEVENARRQDIDLRTKVWTKTVKTRRRQNSRTAVEKRRITIPLSDAAVDLLLSLPSFIHGKPKDFIFPSSNGQRIGNWDRIQKSINIASRTSNWHRHDLRRTAATILRQLGVSPTVIDTLLCHVNPLSAEKVSGAATNYLINQKVLKDVADNERVAVNLLAEATLSIIENREDISQQNELGVSSRNNRAATKKSPWSVA